MAEYIERDKLLRDINHYHLSDGKFQHWVEVQQAADVAPVRHGRWISVPHKLARVCSVCNRDEPYKFADIDADVYDYCPNCGAKMDMRSTVNNNANKEIG